MSKQTYSKFLRKNEQVKLEDGSTQWIPRASTLPPLPDKESVCYECGNPMAVTDGQRRMYCSKVCRKNARHGWHHK